MIAKLLDHRKSFWDDSRADPIGLANISEAYWASAYVAVEKAERLAEDCTVRELLLTYLQSLRIKVIEAVSGLALTPGRPRDHTGVRLERVALGVAKKDLAALKRRVTEFQTGRERGRKRYGTLPTELEALKQMRRLRRKPKKGKRMSYAKIADELNHLGIPAKDGGRWLPGTVAKVMNRRLRTS